MAKSKKVDQGVIGRVKNLLSDKSQYFTRDVDDIDTARSVLSGFGFDEKDRKFRGEMKPEITIPLLDSWIAQAVSSYTQAPFGLGLKARKGVDITPYTLAFEDVQNKNDFNYLVAKVLEDTLKIGASYVLVQNEIIDDTYDLQVPKIKLLDARKVVMDICDEDDGSDCDFAVVIDVISKEKAKERYDFENQDFRFSKDIISGLKDVVIDTKIQCSVITTYEKMKDFVRISKIVYDKVIDSVDLKIDRIPIVRFVADQVYIEKQLHYRGVYHKIADMWKMVNFSASELQSRIGLAETSNWVGDIKGIAQDQSSWEQGSDSLIKGYASWDGNNQIAPPIQVSKQLWLPELQSCIDAIVGLIAKVLGSPSTETRANETAEAVLTKRSTAEASINKYMSSFKKSLKSLGLIELQMMGIVYDVEREVEGAIIPAISSLDGIYITVDDGPFTRSEKMRNLQQVMALQGMATQAQIPDAFVKMLPVIIEASDMPKDQKKYILDQFQPAPSQPVIPPEIQAQLVQKDTMMAQMQKQMADMQGYLQKLEIMLETKSYEVASRVKMNTDNNENDLQIKIMDIEADNAQLRAKLLSDQAKQTQKAEADLEKARIANRPEAYEVIQDFVPDMNRGM